MTLKQSIYLSLAVVAFVIGIHRTLTFDSSESVSTAIGYNYWIFMLTLVFLMLFRFSRQKNNS